MIIIFLLSLQHDSDTSGDSEEDNDDQVVGCGYDHGTIRVTARGVSCSVVPSGCLLDPPP